MTNPEWSPDFRMAWAPPLLYHGTDPVNVQAILAFGLIPNQDGYVYLSETPEIAAHLGKGAAIFSVKLDIVRCLASDAGTWVYRPDGAVDPWSLVLMEVK